MSGRPDPSVQAIRECLLGRRDVQLALVFGSRARGTATLTSDVDVAVRAPGVDLLDLAAELSRATGLDVDVVDLEHAGVPLLKRIVAGGPPGARAPAWHGRHVAGARAADLETDAPWFARMRDAWLARVAARGL